jgi:hypothetical protein
MSYRGSRSILSPENFGFLGLGNAIIVISYILIRVSKSNWIINHKILSSLHWNKYFFHNTRENIFIFIDYIDYQLKHFMIL